MSFCFSFIPGAPAVSQRAETDIESDWRRLLQRRKTLKSLSAGKRTKEVGDASSQSSQGSPDPAESLQSGDSHNKSRNRRECSTNLPLTEKLEVENSSLTSHKSDLRAQPLFTSSPSSKHSSLSSPSHSPTPSPTPSPPSSPAPSEQACPWWLLTSAEPAVCEETIYVGSVSPYSQEQLSPPSAEELLAASLLSRWLAEVSDPASNIVKVRSHIIAYGTLELTQSVSAYLCMLCMMYDYIGVECRHLSKFKIPLLFSFSVLSILSCYMEL